jgi:hypothetical protein
MTKNIVLFLELCLFLFIYLFISLLSDVALIFDIDMGDVDVSIETHMKYDKLLILKKKKMIKGPI